jgi:hypothetical protein
MTISALENAQNEMKHIRRKELMKLGIFGEYDGIMVGLSGTHLQIRFNEIKCLRRICRMKLSAFRECAE